MEEYLHEAIRMQCEFVMGMGELTSKMRDHTEMHSRSIAPAQQVRDRERALKMSHCLQIHAKHEPISCPL